MRRGGGVRRGWGEEEGRSMEIRQLGERGAR